MMDTPICDFVKRYAESDDARLHMPGHKGASFLGFEKYDITEIDGADSLFDPDGIIRRSESNAGSIFGCPTFYSTEGSSHTIRAMLYLAQVSSTGRMKIAAGRNAHKVFLSAAALLDIDVDWLMPESGSYLSCPIMAADVEAYLSGTDELPRAVYLTSPDYLGNTVDVAAIAEVCHSHGVMFLVDGAHGSYLRFLSESRHPMDLGADMCAASAHKTLPVLTGGAYLHVSAALTELCGHAKDALMMFGSTSPSYLILASLDRANQYLAGHRDRLAEFLPSVESLCRRLRDHGYDLAGDEPMKVTVCPKSYGYSGAELAAILAEAGFVHEFADPDNLVLMPTPELSADALTRLCDVLTAVPRKSPIKDEPPRFALPERVMSVREAALSPALTVAAKDAAGRVLASPGVGCPPAVPIVMCGERIDGAAVECFRYYGIETVKVVK